MFGSAEAPKNRLTTDAVKLYRNEIIKVRCRFSEPMNQDPIPFCNRTSSRNAPMELHYPLSGRLGSIHIIQPRRYFFVYYAEHSVRLSNGLMTCNRNKNYTFRRNLFVFVCTLLYINKQINIKLHETVDLQNIFVIFNNHIIHLEN